jgi:transcription elongation GreA/GreB family factor
VRFQAGRRPESELGRAAVAETDKSPQRREDELRFLFTDSGEDFRLALVDPKDAQGEHDRISILAPVGSALLGLTADGPCLAAIARGRQSAALTPVLRLLLAR